MKLIVVLLVSCVLVAAVFAEDLTAEAHKAKGYGRGYGGYGGGYGGGHHISYPRYYTSYHYPTAHHYYPVQAHGGYGQGGHAIGGGYGGGHAIGGGYGNGGYRQSHY